MITYLGIAVVAFLAGMLTGACIGAYLLLDYAMKRTQPPQMRLYIAPKQDQAWPTTKES